MYELAVIIANWNGRNYLKDCLETLRNQTAKNFRVILVDNGSEDDSVFFVEKNYPDVEIVKLPKNTGFAFANNLGIEKAFEDANIQCVLTLNNDTKVDSKFVEEMLKCAENHPDAGSIQSKVVNFYDPKIIDSTGILVYGDASASNRGQKEKDNGQYGKEEEIFGASASAALYARKALEKVKLPRGDYFDEDYFAYYEDVDLAWRMRLFGFKSFYNPQALVYHIHSATGKNHSPFKSFHIHRNQYYNIIKNLPPVFLARALAFMPVRYLFLATSVLANMGPASELSKKQGKDNILVIVFRSWRDIIKNLPKLIEKRKFIQKNKSVKNKKIKRWFKSYKADFRKMIFN